MPVLSWIRADGFGSGEGCLIKCGAQRMEKESVTSGGFAAGILRITALCFFGYAKARFRVPPTGLRVQATTLVNDPGHPDVYFSQ
jgi:hypothetical protein